MDLSVRIIIVSTLEKGIRKMQLGVSIVKNTIGNMQKNAAKKLSKRLMKLATRIGVNDKRPT